MKTGNPRGGRKDPKAEQILFPTEKTKLSDSWGEKIPALDLKRQSLPAKNKVQIRNCQEWCLKDRSKGEVNQSRVTRSRPNLGIYEHTDVLLAMKTEKNIPRRKGASVYEEEKTCRPIVCLIREGRRFLKR